MRGDTALQKLLEVFPLHSSLSSREQRAIFKKMPRGVRKVVVSTNIAETSITIEDCTHVIDSGRVKELRYSAASGFSSLLEVWVSHASGMQRAGRAGRVRAGRCWRLYPEVFWETSMPEHTLPEMRRTPLEELVLQVMVLELGSPSEVLGRAVEPPPPAMIQVACLTSLLLLSLISANVPHLTPLGYHLAHLPVDSRVGKLLIYGCIFRCLDPILTVAAALSSQPPFLRPFNDMGRADAAKRAFAADKSDHLAVVQAYQAWSNAKASGGRSNIWQFCRDNFLSSSALDLMERLREQFLQQLQVPETLHLHSRELKLLSPPNENDTKSSKKHLH
ncbi:unnamed protein product [Chrysoparadoxa australica]